MTQLNISAEGDEAADVLTAVLQNLSGVFEAESYTGEVRFGDLSLTASGNTPEIVAEQLSLIEYKDEPDALSAAFDDVVVREDVSGTFDVAETSDEAEADDGNSTYEQIQRQNTMEQVALYCLLQTYSQTPVSTSRAGSVETEEYVHPDDISDEVPDEYEVTYSQMTNALYRLHKRNLADREKHGRTYHYRLNTNGSAELTRIGEPDWEDTPLVPA